MPGQPSRIERAYRRIAILRNIVAEERRRAEADPFGERLKRLGIRDGDLPRKDARRQVDEAFAELSLLLEHLHVAHVAAAFEHAAKARISGAIGEARTAITADRKGRTRWPERLVRELHRYEGLAEIGRLVELTPALLMVFNEVRETRNRFVHATEMEAPPTVNPEDAAELLLQVYGSLD